MEISSSHHPSIIFNVHDDAGYYRFPLAPKRLKKTLTTRHRWPNVTRAEQTVIQRMREFDVGYDHADKNYGTVVSSKELFKEQCLMHLEDGKGTYCKIADQSREDILEEILSLLLLILIPFRRQSEELKRRVNHSRLKQSSRGRTVVQFLYHMEAAQGSLCLRSTEPTHCGGHRLRDRSCLALPALLAKGGCLKTSTCLKGLVGAYPDRGRAALRC